MKKYIAIILFILGCPGLSSADWESGFTDRQKITFTSSATMIPGSLSNFPALIGFTHDDLRTTANGGHVTNSSGYDIRFTSSDGTTDLSHELEYYNASSGQLIAWVKIPSLTTGTVIYIYYGNPAISSDPSATAVWDSNYLAVYHMDESDATLDDSTSSDRDASKDASTSPAQAAGKIGHAQNFDGGDDDAEMAQTAFNDLGEVTLSAWIRMDTWGENGEARIIDKNRWYLRVDEDDGALYYYQHTTSATSEKEWRTGTNTLTTGTWYHVALVYKHDRTVGTTADPLIYINGENQSITQIQDSGWDSLSDVGSYIHIGNDNGDSRTFDGLTDELRISNTMRSANWIKSSYYNQVDPSSFYTLSQAISVDLRTADDSGDYSSWAIGSVDVDNVSIMTSANCVLVKNTGDLSEDFSLKASCSSWTLGSSTGTDTAILMGLFNGSTGPAAEDFSLGTDLLGANATWATADGGSGRYEGLSAAAAVGVNTGENLYIYLKTPSGTSAPTQETITVTVGCRAAQ